MRNSLKVVKKGRVKIPLTFLTTLAGPGIEFYVTTENALTRMVGQRWRHA